MITRKWRNWSDNNDTNEHLFRFYIIAAIQDGPEFIDVIENITVPAGRNVKLACSVKNLGPYKVSSSLFEIDKNI